MVTMSRIEALRAKEDTTNACYNYFQGRSHREGINQQARKSMIQWIQQVSKSLKLSSETSWIASSFFDRYMSSGKGKSEEALDDRYMFQLAAISSFYVAVKVNESVELSVAALAKLCKGYYKEADIASMEEDILFALDWRVACPTPIEIARHLLELLPEEVDSETVLEACRSHLDHASTDFYFTFCKPSVIGASCFASALTETGALSSSQRQSFWMQLATVTDLIEVMEAQKQLLKGRKLSKPAPVVSTKKSSGKSRISEKIAKVVQKKSVPKSIVLSAPRSPVCVTQVARVA
jgi:hypothetical protein